MFFFFFFQAEDGIRDYKVTGVQTCALPIWFEVSLAIARETSNRYQEAWALFNRGQMAKRRERRDEARGLLTEGGGVFTGGWGGAPAGRGDEERQGLTR